MSPDKQKKTNITRTQTQPLLVKYVLDHKGKEFTVEQIMSYTGFSARQVRSGMYRLVEQGKVPGLSVLVGAQIWQYHPTEDVTAEQVATQAALKPRRRSPASRYELVGTVGDKVLVRPEGGTDLFVLTPLEI